jgi:hypothetical protein
MSARQRQGAAGAAAAAGRAGGGEEENVFTEAMQAQRDARRRSVDYVSNKLHAAFWVALAVVAVYFTRLWEVVVLDERVSRGWFNAGVVFLALQVGLVLYLTVWVRYVRRITLEWEAYCPRVLQASVWTGLVAFLLFSVGLWPVFGLLTVPLLLLLVMGLVMSTHFMPILW